MIVPFVVFGAPAAVATFVMTPESGRRHGPADLALAQEMARSVARMIENARLHQQVERSEQRFRVALEHSNISIFETDLELRVRWVYNSRLAPGDRELIGQSALALFPGAAGTELEQLRRRVLSGDAGASEAMSTLIAGGCRHYLVHYEPLRGAGGAVVGLTGASVDVTELKQAQAELAQELVFRERMMGILGHDLRNPVSAVLGLAGLLRLQNGASDKTREGLQVIEQSARRMNEMIGTLLDFTQLRFRGSLPIMTNEVDLDELAHALVEELRVAHRGRQIELESSGDLRGQWDPGRLAQVVCNLVGNALSHGARESPVRISLGDEGSEVVARVSNRGPVIPRDQVDRLFEPFQRGPEQSDGGRSRGLGLGLFIVGEIVRAHGGTISVCSSEELTTFAVTLPRRARP
jgi:PAS domain S-box-containing protein